MLEEPTGGGGTAARRRVRARVEGTVQGVGFRPFVYRLALELDLAGFVLNDTRGVLLEVEGEASAVDRFLERLADEPPPLARIERILPEEVAPGGRPGFEIVASDAGGEAAAAVSPDSATCADCLAELLDPGDRRHRYPFINCTNCGPRFTIVRGVPYDRLLTTMAGFEMCERCRSEYEDPLDRRFHAQPNACPDCGPAAWLTDAVGDVIAGGGGDAVRAAAEALAGGRIVAVKGLGGYHLACRADDETVVAALRARKHREDKPFALMAPDLDAARGLVDLTEEEVAVLTGPERPIVVARRRNDASVADAVAPRARDLGVMLPYTPLHHLLLADAGTTLVMTSANLSDEPIAYRDDDARSRLGEIADLFLLHDRPIHMRTDDSVVRSVAVGRGEPMLLRRSRGYVPAVMGLPVAAARPVLACGAELKSTFCLAKARRAWVSHHIGDLHNFETLQSFTEGIAHFEALFAVAPEIVAHDLHPDYLSTRHALDREGVEHLGVQHHHAHLASCLAEHGETGPAVGAIYDGTGYGLDGTVWGGELLVGGLDGFERAGHLRPVRLPGGDRAVREPWRMACAWLVDALDEELPPRPNALVEAVDELRWRQVASLVRSGLAAPLTTSAGRLFDAVAAICGIRSQVNYEGQAAVELEAAADAHERGAYAIALGEEADGLILDPREAVVEVAYDVAAGTPVAVVSARFHRGMADATARACALLAEGRGLETVVLSGGVFQNRLLLERTAARLEEAGMHVLRPVRLPANDGGIAYGQAAIAAAAPR